MKLSDLLADIPVTSMGDSVPLEIEIETVRSDSREKLEGSLFACIPGTRQDGHEFAKEASGRAAAVLVERDVGLPNQILTPNVREAYARICGNFFGNPGRELSLIAVTGTNGKTSVATIIHRLLNQAGIRAGLISTIQAEYGGKAFPMERTTPDAFPLQRLLAQMRDAGMTAVALEASSHALDQERLGGLWFTVGVFTNLTQDHLDYHRTMEAYYQAKKKLFSRTAFGVLNLDDPFGRRLAEEITIPYAGCTVEGEKAEYAAEGISCGMQGVRFTLVNGPVRCPMEFGIPGVYSVQNALAAIAVCRRMGLSFGRIRAGLREVGSIPGRSELLASERGFQVLCDYAHTPDGLENLLKSVRAVTNGKLTLVFGCGGDRDAGKRPLMGRAAACYADRLILTSDNPRTEDPMEILRQIEAGLPEGTDYRVICDRAEAIRAAVLQAEPGETVILAGKGHERVQILGNRQIAFDERALVRQILRETAPRA